MGTSASVYEGLNGEPLLDDDLEGAAPSRNGIGKRKKKSVLKSTDESSNYCHRH
jgi:hypothetical protein